MTIGLNDPRLTVVPEGRCERIDAFVNASGGISLRQADGLGELAPGTVSMRPEHVDAVVAALLRLKVEACS